jgi:hypothetical protein
MIQINPIGVANSIPHTEAHMGDARLQRVVGHECNILHPSDPIHPMILMADHEYLCNHYLVRSPAGGLTDNPMAITHQQPGNTTTFPLDPSSGRSLMPR